MLYSILQLPKKICRGSLRYIILYDPYGVLTIDVSLNVNLECMT